MIRAGVVSLSLLGMALSAADFPAPAGLPVQAELPDPLVTRSGSRVNSKEAWVMMRAPELRSLFAHYMFGKHPPAGKVDPEVRHEDKAALGGKATLREFEVDVGLGSPVRLLVLTPNDQPGPRPCFLGMNFNGNFRLVGDPAVAEPRWTREAGGDADSFRGTEQESWGIGLCLARGYAVASFHSGDVVPDDPALAEEALRRMRGKPGPRGPADTATIMAWAWGFSRMVDVLQTLPEIDGRRIAAVGHSRNGKTALVAAAFDSRIAMAIPSQAGCGGSGPNRIAPELAAPQDNGRPKAETVAAITSAFPHWFAGNFKEFAGAVGKLPFDQHCLIALCAPRPVLLSNALDDLWANPDGQFEMLRAAAPVYALFGEAPPVPTRRPPSGQLHNERLGYFIRAGKHSMTALDWQAWLEYADKWLK